MSQTDNNSETAPSPAVALARLVRRCAAYNAIHATEFTPETYDEERTRVPRLIAWDEGWEACEATLDGECVVDHKDGYQYAGPFKDEDVAREWIALQPNRGQLRLVMNAKIPLPNDQGHAAAEVRAEGSTKTPEERADLEASFQRRINPENANSAGAAACAPSQTDG